MATTDTHVWWQRATPEQRTAQVVLKRLGFAAQQLRQVRDHGVTQFAGTVTKSTQFDQAFKAVGLALRSLAPHIIPHYHRHMLQPGHSAELLQDEKEFLLELVRRYGPPEDDAETTP